ncbi:MAG: serine hydrolase [Planctomycetota bacterium JB042]
MSTWLLAPLSLLPLLAPPADDAWSDLSARWRDRLARHDVPGLAVAVVAADRVLHAEGFGVRDAAGGAVDPETVFYIASATKPFTAFAVALLAEDGRLSIDAPVRSALPRFALATPEATADVTILDLLSHRRGLTAHPAIVFNDAYTGQITEDRFFRLLRRSAPREEYRYNNLHFTILGRVVEAASGLHWKEFLARRVFTPLSMTRTSGNVSTFAGDPNVAVGLERRGDAWAEVALAKTDATMHAAGGLKTTVLDLARWIRLHLNGGEVDGVRIASDATMTAMTTPVVEFDGAYGPFTRDACASGWNVGTYDGRTMVHHFGGYVGFAAHVSFLPEHGVGVAVVANGSGAASSAVHVVACDVYDRLIGTSGGDDAWAEMEAAGARASTPPIERRPGPVAADGLMLDAAAYEGRYEHDDWGTVVVSIEGGELAARIGNLRPRFVSSALDGVRFDLFPGSEVDGWFVLDDDEEEVVAFVVSANGDEVEFERRG